jgi:hypothetical protein
MPASSGGTEIVSPPSGTQTATSPAAAGNAAVSAAPPSPDITAAPAPSAAPSTDVASSPSGPSATEPVAPAPSNSNIVPYSSAAPSVAPAPPVPAVAHAPVFSTADKEALDAHIASLSARIDELKKGLDQATQQLGQESAMLATPSGGQGNAVLEERLAKIEQQLSQLKHSHSSSSASLPVSAPAAATSPEQESMTQATEAAASAVTKPALHKEAKLKHNKVKTHKSAQAVQKTQRVAKHGAKSKEASTRWVLRAATPDEAWIAKDASSAELRHVQVGDELPGIGRVNAIHQAGDAWTIEGAQGTIH